MCARVCVCVHACVCVCVRVLGYFLWLMIADSARHTTLPHSAWLIIICTKHQFILFTNVHLPLQPDGPDVYAGVPKDYTKKVSSSLKQVLLYTA